MVKDPERIWAFLYTGSRTKGAFETASISWGTEYVRADRIEALERQLADEKAAKEKAEREYLRVWNERDAQRRRAETAERQLAERDAELARMRLDLRASECLQDSQYKAGIGAGWNFAVRDDEEGFQAAMASTEHIAELKRIRQARAALSGSGDGWRGTFPPTGPFVEPKLKPCPFCGNEARYGRGGEEWDERLWTAGCEYGHAVSPEMDTIEEAAAWWNRRRRGKRATSPLPAIGDRA